MGLYDFTFYHLIYRNAVSFKGRQAWLEAEDGRSLTFEQYKAQVDQLAAGLQKAGVAKGTASESWPRTVWSISLFSERLQPWARSWCL